MASKSPLEINFLPSSISPPPAGEDGGEAKNFSYASSSKEKRKERKRRERMRERAWCVCRGEARCFFEGRGKIECIHVLRRHGEDRSDVSADVAR